MSTPATTGKVSLAGAGMILFIASEVMFFGGLFTAHFSLRASQETWPPAGTPVPGLLLPALATVVLLASSLTQHRAAAAPDAAGARRWLAVTLGLGGAFVAAQAFEWSRLIGDGLSLSSDAYGTSFFTLTGAHGLHVLGGLVMLAAARLKLGRGEISEPQRGVLHAVTYYWHFVDVVWLVVFAVVYATV